MDQQAAEDLAKEAFHRIWEAYTVYKQELESAVICLQEIAAMGRKAGSETAAHWLQRHGHPREQDGYVPGKGFRDADSAAPTPTPQGSAE